jgi:phospholipid transport system substrate-binding protein
MRRGSRRVESDRDETCEPVLALAVLIPSFLLAAIVAAVPVSAVGASGPETVIRETTDAVIAVLARKDLSVEQKHREIEQIVDTRFDFTTLSRLVLARNWNTLTPEQQQRFVAEFQRHLSLTYGRNIETYNQERVVITGEREEVRGDRTVKTRIARPSGEDIQVDYRLRETDGIWRVIDVVIEGVSLVANYRSQFQSIISRDGPAKLIDILHDKNEKGEVFDQGRAASGG